MNAAPLLDVPAAPATAAELPTPEMPAQTTDSQPAAAFDDLLADIDLVPPPLPEKEKKDDPVADCALGLLSFCPPPPPPPLPDQPELKEAPAAQPANPEMNVAAEQQKVEVTATELPPPITPESAKPLADLVRPQSHKPKKPESKGIPLDSKVFEAVKEPILAITQKPANTASAHGGTVVAQLEKQMKNAEKTAEIAPPIEQKMPVRDTSRRIAQVAARLEPASFVGSSEFSPKIDFQVGQTSDIKPVKSLDAAHLVESIRTEVASFRHRPDSSVSVVLKPESGGELMLSLSVAHDGAIHVQARCDRGNFDSLNAQWGQLQQSLGAQGIRMADLSNTGNSNQHSFNNGNPQNFGREQNPQQSRREQNAPSFEEEMSNASPRFAGAKTNFQTPRSARRSWQSWA